MTSTVPDFNTLSEEEKRDVAERLMKIEESGWKPFWCADPGCNGDPHWKVEKEADGSLVNIFVDASEEHGPNGEPLSEVLYEMPEGDLVEDKVLVTDSGVINLPTVGRAVLDPQWAHNHARADQRLPSWLKPWILFIMSGRGSGKTRTGVEFVTLNARKGLDGAIVGRRGTELENTHVKALIENAHPEFVPVYYASKDILVWPEVTMPDGSKRQPTTFLFSAERPENIRSVNLSYCWFDEAAFMDEIETAWMNAKLATRVKSHGNPIHILITSTPTSTPWVMKMEDDPGVELRRVSTYANRKNLDPDFLKELEREYEGTRMGRQELHGEVLRDVEGALWNDDIIKHHKIEDPVAFIDYLESLDDIILAIDPAGSKGKRSDATGIIGVGTHIYDDDGEYLSASTFSVLCDATLKGSPTEWARQAFAAARVIRATRIVAEKNFGGDMVKQVLTDFAKLHPLEAKNHEGDDFKIEVVHAVQGKETRAEGTVGKYEQGRVTHILNKTAWGDLSMLEKEQVGWVPKSRGGRFPSPNRVDALVWAVRQLELKVRYGTQTASSAQTLSKLIGGVGFVPPIQTEAEAEAEAAEEKPVSGKPLAPQINIGRPQRWNGGSTPRYPVRLPRQG